jgi:hypothetical protein
LLAFLATIGQAFEQFEHLIGCHPSPFERAMVVSKLRAGLVTA